MKSHQLRETQRATTGKAQARGVSNLNPNITYQGAGSFRQLHQESERGVVSVP